MPMDLSRYPSNWREISLARRESAGWQCEWCGAKQGEPNPATGSKVVLTVAHLDHTPANCEPDNLRSLCQKCHLTYDAQHHAANAAETRRRRKKQAGQIEMVTA